MPDKGTMNRGNLQGGAALSEVIIRTKLTESGRMCLHQIQFDARYITVGSGEFVRLTLFFLRRLAANFRGSENNICILNLYMYLFGLFLMLLCWGENGEKKFQTVSERLFFVCGEESLKSIKTGVFERR